MDEAENNINSGRLSDTDLLQKLNTQRDELARRLIEIERLRVDPEAPSFFMLLFFVQITLILVLTIYFATQTSDGSETALRLALSLAVGGVALLGAWYLQSRRIAHKRSVLDKDYMITQRQLNETKQVIESYPN